jgi:hypothetical protein
MTTYTPPTFSGHLISANLAAEPHAPAHSTRKPLSRGATTLMLAIGAALALVAATAVFDTWSDHHLLIVWSLVWALAFVGLAMLAAPLRRSTVYLLNASRALRVRQQAAAADRKLWELAMSDPRIMADLSRAMTRDAAQEVRGFS